MWHLLPLSLERSASAYQWERFIERWIGGNMRKLLLLIAIAGWGALFGCGSAMAQSIEGRWLNAGSNGQGVQYQWNVVFAGNGALQTVMDVGVPGMMGSGVTHCQGSYQFDGQLLQTQGSCVVCPAGGACVPGSPLQLGGPVEFQNPYTFSIGGDVFRRQ